MFFKPLICTLFSYPLLTIASTWTVIYSDGTYTPSSGTNVGANGTLSTETGLQLPNLGCVGGVCQGTLGYCLWNATTGDTIDFAVENITLQNPLPAVLPGFNGALTINGNGATINGNNTYPIFASVGTATSSNPITISNLTLTNGASIGGAGSSGLGYLYSGGGGGAGGGGGIYVAQGTYLKISNLTIENCQAIGGNGGAGSETATNYASGGGGGGYGGGSNTGQYISGGGGAHPGGGAGGSITATPNGTAAINYTSSGGGGGSTLPGYGGSSSIYKGGAPQSVPSGSYGGAGGGIGGTPLGTSSIGLGPEDYGAGGAGATDSPEFGINAVGSAGGGSSYSGPGGAGGPYGGGGGGGCGIDNGGMGGFGGGGGGSGFYPGHGGASTALGGNGGTPSSSGNTSPGGGGGGAGMGGAIFIQIGGTLEIDSPIVLQNNSVRGGAGGYYLGSPGSALGTDIFLRSGGSLIFNLGSNSLTLNNPIQSDQGVGLGSWTTNGGLEVSSGFLTLSGANTYTGGTQIASGASLTISPTSSGQSGSILGALSNPVATNNVVNNGNFYINNSTFTYSGIISGSGSLQTENKAALTLSAVNTYTGNTTVNSGTQLTLSGSGQIKGSTTESIYTNYGSTSLNGSSTLIQVKTFTNEAGATLQGCGTISAQSGSGTVSNYGGVYTGCSPTPLYITGNFTSLPGSLISPSIDTTGIATLIVSGDTLLDSNVTLEVEPEPGCYPNEISFPVITAASLSGTFSQIDNKPLFLSSSLSYSSTEAILTIRKVPFSQFANSHNSSSIAQALDKAFGASKAACFLMTNAFYASKDELKTLSESMSPSLFKGITLSQENNAVSVEKALSMRLEDLLDSKFCFPICRNQEEKKSCTHHCPFEQKDIFLWVDGFGDLLQQKSINDFQGSYQVGYTTKTGGGVIGLDTRLFDIFYFGLLGAYTGSNVDFRSDFGKGSINSVYGGLYFSAIGNLFYGNVSVIGQWSHFTGHRNILFPDRTLTANHSNGGDGILSHVDTGLNFHYKGFVIRPFDSFDYVSQTEHGYQEHGAHALNLKIDRSTSILIRNELGLELASCICTGVHKLSFAPKLSWVREVRVKGSHYNGSFVEEEGTNFIVSGYFPDRSLISPGFLISSSHYDNLLTVDLYYDGQFGHKFQNQNYGGEIRFGF